MGQGQQDDLGCHSGQYTKVRGSLECHLRGGGGGKTKLTWQQGPPQPDNYDVNGDDADNDTDQEVITHLFVNIHSEEWLRARFDLQFHLSNSCKRSIFFFLSSPLLLLSSSPSTSFSMTTQTPVLELHYANFMQNLWNATFLLGKAGEGAIYQARPYHQLCGQNGAQHHNCWVLIHVPMRMPKFRQTPKYHFLPCSLVIHRGKFLCLLHCCWFLVEQVPVRMAKTKYS